jgi:hypothetical protein
LYVDKSKNFILELDVNAGVLCMMIDGAQQVECFKEIPEGVCFGVFFFFLLLLLFLVHALIMCFL